jgi:hypothetical protein
MMPAPPPIDSQTVPVVTRDIAAPWVAILLYVAGSIGVVAGLFAMLLHSAVPSESAGNSGLGIMGGLVLIGLAKVVTILNRIESKLRE